MRTVCQHITLHSLLIFHHANMRCSSLRIRVPKNSLSSTPHVSFLASPDTDHYHSSLSPTSPILHSSSLHTQPCCLTTHIYTATIHGGFAVLRISNRPREARRHGHSEDCVLIVQSVQARASRQLGVLPTPCCRWALGPVTLVAHLEFRAATLCDRKRAVFRYGEARTAHAAGHDHFFGASCSRLCYLNRLKSQNSVSVQAV